MNVTRSAAFTPRALSTPSAPGSTPPSAAEGKKDPYAAFDESNVDKHRVSYELAYNLGRGVALATEGGARIGQAVSLGSSALGLATTPLAHGVGLVAGTIDVARGASIAQQGAINRNSSAAILGGLQVAQGVATWVAVGSAMAGAPALVSQVATGAVAAAWLSREGLELKNKHFPAAPPKAPTERQPVSFQLDEKAKPHGEGRTLEKSFALAKAISDGVSQAGGMAAGWNNVSALWSGSAPTGVWQGLGIVGGTYSILQGAAQMGHAAGNQHLEDTVTGALGVVQGAASLAVSLGAASHLAGGVALGAWALKAAVPMLQLKKRLGASQGDTSMMDRVKENVGYALFPGSSQQKGPGGPPA